jgi:hypothetical protein
MVARGELEVTQRGRVVDLDSVPDAIDVRFASPPDAADWAPRRRLATVRAAHTEAMILRARGCSSVG